MSTLELVVAVEMAAQILQAAFIAAVYIEVRKMRKGES